MRLPPRIEKQIRDLESFFDRMPGQHSSPAKLRDLRWSIEDFMRANNLKWNSGEVVDVPEDVVLRND